MFNGDALQSILVLILISTVTSRVITVADGEIMVPVTLKTEKKNVNNSN